MKQKIKKIIVAIFIFIFLAALNVITNYLN